MPELVCAANSPDWLLERRKGVTATDITAITGLSPYESAYSLFFKKRGDIPDEHQDNDRLRLGRELEPIIIARWLDTQTPRPNDEGAYSALYRSSDRPWQLATPDRLFYDEPLEVKSWADADRQSWGASAYTGRVGDDCERLDPPPPIPPGEVHMPARVRVQVLWQMDTLDVATGHVGVLFLPSGEFRSYTLTHPTTYDEADEIDRTVCDICTDISLLREAGRDFMDRLDLNQPPSPDASSATLAALKARFTDVHHDKTAEIDVDLWALYDGAKNDRDYHEQVMRGHEAKIREQAGEARTLTVNGEKVATRVVGDAEVKAHTRHSDYIRRATRNGETDA